MYDWWGLDVGAPVAENSAWITMDLLVQTRDYTYDDLDLATFIAEASYAAAQITYTDQDGNTQTCPRYSGSLFIRQRRTAADVLLNFRRSFGGILIPNSVTGKQQLLIEKMADQQGTLGTVPGTNYGVAIASHHANGTTASGYPAYHFDENSILAPDGKTTLKVINPTIPNTVNRVSVKFADSAPGLDYAESSVSVPNIADIDLIDQENEQALQMDGLRNENQARRMLAGWRDRWPNRWSFRRVLRPAACRSGRSSFFLMACWATIMTSSAS